MSLCLRHPLRCDRVARAVGGELSVAAACVAQLPAWCHSACLLQQPQGCVWAAVIDRVRVAAPDFTKHKPMTGGLHSCRTHIPRWPLGNLITFIATYDALLSYACVLAASIYSSVCPPCCLRSAAERPLSFAGPHSFLRAHFTSCAWLGARGVHDAAGGVDMVLCLLAPDFTKHKPMTGGSHSRRTHIPRWPLGNLITFIATYDALCVYVRLPAAHPTLRLPAFLHSLSIC